MVARFLAPRGQGESFLTQHFAPVFSSELARHLDNPGGLGLDDLSFTWGKYEAAVGTWGTPVGRVTTGPCGQGGWTSQPQAGALVSADGAKRPCLLGKYQPERLAVGCGQFGNAV